MPLAAGRATRVRIAFRRELHQSAGTVSIDFEVCASIVWLPNSLLSRPLAAPRSHRRSDRGSVAPEVPENQGIPVYGRPREPALAASPLRHWLGLQPTLVHSRARQRRKPNRAKLIASLSSPPCARVRSGRLAANTVHVHFGRRLDVADRETLLTPREVTHGRAFAASRAVGRGRLQPTREEADGARCRNPCAFKSFERR